MSTILFGIALFILAVYMCWCAWKERFPKAIPPVPANYKERDVKNCSACKKDHTAIKFFKMEKPDSEGYTHVGLCPNTYVFIYQKDI